MAEKKAVLVTGVAGYWGSKLAARILAENKRLSAIRENEKVRYQVLGMDSEAPSEPIQGLDFIQADVRNPLLIELLHDEKISAVCHLGFVENVWDNEPSFDLNVIGTMKVLGACAEAGVHKVVLRSSTTVYGANPTNPAFLTEASPLRVKRSYASTQHWRDIESFCNGFRQQVPEMILTSLRFSSIIGPTVDSPMTRFLKQNPTPVLLGFDPLMQVIHENDVVEALAHSIFNDIPGVYNIAAEGILPLSKILGLIGRFPLPIFHRFAYWEIGLCNTLKHKPEHHFPIEPDYIRYPWIADIARMRDEMGFNPIYTADELLREYAGLLRLQKSSSGSPDLAYDEERLRDTLYRRKRIKVRHSGDSVDPAGGEND